MDLGYQPLIKRVELGQRTEPDKPKTTTYSGGIIAEKLRSDLEQRRIDHIWKMVEEVAQSS